MGTEYAVSWFSSPIAFSITTEDHAVVEKGLGMRGGEAVVCIASSGDTPLNLLLLDPQRVECVDFSFPQICLSKLKVEGMRRLSLDEFRRLLGVVREPGQAIRAYQQLRNGLTLQVRDFWDQHRRMIERGVLWEGGLTRLIRLLRTVLGLVLPRAALPALMRVATPEDARAFCDEYIEPRRFQWIFRLLVNAATCRLFFPGRSLEHRPPGMSRADFALHKVRDVVLKGRLADNPYLFPMLFGSYPSLDAVPPYLSDRHYEVIRSRLDRLSFAHSDIIVHLTRAEAREIDAFALCNVVDWLAPSAIAALTEQLRRVGKPGARVLALSRSLALATWPAFRAGLTYDADASRILSAADRTAYHASVNVFRVNGDGGHGQAHP